MACRLTPFDPIIGTTGKIPVNRMPGLESEKMVILKAKKQSKVGLFQRGSIWYYQFALPDKRRIKGSTATDDKEKALAIAQAEYNRLVLALGNFESPDEMTAQNAFALFRDRKYRNRSEKTKALHDNFVAKFIKYFGNVPLSKLSKFHIEGFRDHLLKENINCPRWKTEKKLSPKTVIEILAWLNSVYKYLELNSPVASVERPRKTKEQVLDETITFYTDDEMENILDASKGTVFELPLIFLLNTGCRPAELHSLRNSSKFIDREKKIVRFVDKMQRVRGIQLSEKPFSLAWDALLKWIEINNIKEGELLFPENENWLRKRWHTVLKRAGMPLVRVHQLRHQFVKKCFYDFGYDLTWISKWVGNSTNISYEIYSNIFLQSPKKENGKAEESNGVMKPKLPQDIKQRLDAEISANPEYRETLRFYAYAEAAERSKRKNVSIPLDEYKRLVALAEASKGKA